MTAFNDYFVCVCFRQFWVIIIIITLITIRIEVAHNNNDNNTNNNGLKITKQVLINY